MYKVDNPKFRIKVYIEKSYFADSTSEIFGKDYMKEQRSRFALDFHNKFRGFLFEVVPNVNEQYVIFEINSAFVLHKKVINKIKSWLYETYNAAFFEIGGVK